jgi:hypothetical protein
VEGWRSEVGTGLEGVVAVTHTDINHRDVIPPVSVKELPMPAYQRNRRAADRHPVEVADRATVRAIGAITLIGIGAMHFLQIVPTFEATPLLGVAYVMFITACMVLAARLVTGDDSGTWAAAGIACVAAVGGYAFTRLMSTPFDNQDVGNWSCMLGLAALFVEGATVALSTYVLALDGAWRRPALATTELAGRRPAARQITDREAG